MTTNLRLLASITAAVLAGTTAVSAAQSSHLSFATGRVDDMGVRMVAGEVNDEGVFYAEYYTAGRLKVTASFDRLFVDEDTASPRELHDIVLSPTQTKDGFAFTATRNGEQLLCTALLWSDHSISCARPGFVPPGDPACNVFAGHDTRFQCNGLHTYFNVPPTDQVLNSCRGSFRQELMIEDCIRYGYNMPALINDTLNACTGAFRTEDERKFCLFAALAPVEPKDRVPVTAIRTCGARGGTEKAITSCMFEIATGVKQTYPKQKPPAWFEPPTDVLVLATGSGDNLAIARGRRDEVSLRTTGGMIGGEPVMITDAFDAAGALKYSNHLDRVLIGKHSRALREATALDGVTTRGDQLVFRAVFAGVSRQCRTQIGTLYATCK